MRKNKILSKRHKTTNIKTFDEWYDSLYPDKVFTKCIPEHINTEEEEKQFQISKLSIVLQCYLNGFSQYVEPFSVVAVAVD